MSYIKKKEKINFRLEYSCSEDEILMLVVKKQQGNMAYLMRSSNNSLWETNIIKDDNLSLNYFYIVVSNEVINKQGELLKQDISNFIKRREAGQIHSINLSSFNNNLTIIDSWRDETEYSPLCITPFINIFNKNRDLNLENNTYGHVTFEVYAPFVSGGQSIAITGNCNALGNWNLDKAIVLQKAEFPMWRFSVPMFDETSTIEYKFIIKSNNDKTYFEVGENRIIDNKLLVNNIIISAYEPKFNCSKIKLAGFALPIFSMKSDNSYGIGDFSDLKLAIDWAVKTNQRIIQILPINDTTKNHSWKDSYPYSPISSIALHPMYIDVEKIGIINDTTLYNSFKNKAKEVNLRSEVDYEAVDQLKWSYLRTIFTQEVNKTIETKEFIQWFKKNKSWLEPYSYYCALREQYKDNNFENWGEYNILSLTKLRKLALNNAKFNNEVMLHIFIQYHLHIQLAEASEYARAQGIILKGDIQIGVDRHSVDVWQQPELFRTDTQIGAPPDDFAEDGQNWGFPAYNWEAMEKQNYKWWVLRFKHLEMYFDAYRIDHLLGFFRIWEIPITSKNGLLGYFSPALSYSKEELLELGFDVELPGFTSPYITEEMLQNKFTEKRLNYVKYIYFNKEENDTYHFKEIFNTISKLKKNKYIEQYSDVKKILISIFTDVLFVEENGNFHPRILAHKTFAYSKLSEEQKEKFNNLYNDYFYVRNNDFWYVNVMKKLPTIINATSMLACVEDLGMIPSIVPTVISEMGLLSLEIERMPKQNGVRIGDTNNFPYFSVATTSTHDMSPLRVWWEENNENTDFYYWDILKYKDKRSQTLDGYVAYDIVKRCADSNSLLIVIPIQDWFAIDEAIRRKSYYKERINVPSDNKNQWKYRMHITFEKLLKADSVNKKIRNIISLSDRKYN
ncbi:MAG: 4-alpha-glucanotransferase [Rikenellaceae bacterium]